MTFSTRLFFQFVDRKHISAQQKETSDLLPQPSIKRRVGLRQGGRHIATSKTNEGCQFGPAFFLKIYYWKKAVPLSLRPLRSLCEVSFAWIQLSVIRFSLLPAFQNGTLN